VNSAVTYPQASLRVGVAHDLEFDLGSEQDVSDPAATA
jgi:hypothetical protein